MSPQLLFFWFKTSRPGLYFQWLWLYLLPLGAGTTADLRFWIGLVYVTFPLSLLVYGWNDLADAELDRHNPRKDSLLFGARGSAEERRTLPAAILAVNLPFGLYFLFHSSTVMWAILVGVVLLNALYNHGEKGLRGRPPWELANELGVLLIVAFSVEWNGVPHPSPLAYVYLYAFVVHAHLVGEVMDLEPDRKGGRRTTALLLGRLRTKALIIFLVALEAALLALAFGDLVLAGFLALGLVWLLLDVLVLFKDREYTVAEMRLFGWGMNAAGYISMLWVWYAGTFAP